MVPFGERIRRGRGERGRGEKKKMILANIGRSLTRKIKLLLVNDFSSEAVNSMALF